MDLVRFLRQAELSASQVGHDVVEVESFRGEDASEAAQEISLIIRVWRLVHPAVTVVQVPASG